jgi:hypothetical protein
MATVRALAPVICRELSAERTGQILTPTSLLVDAYTTPPHMRPVERTSREQRRRSIEVSPVPEVRDDDPVFILRNFALVQVEQAKTNAPSSPKGLALQNLPSGPQRTATSDSVYATPSEEIPSPTMQDTRQEIAAQRAASRANQRAILSARKNQEQGVDIRMSNQATIRSSRNLSNARVRYSYIDQDGAEFDISEIVENEWAPGQEAGTWSDDSRSGIVGGRPTPDSTSTQRAGSRSMYPASQSVKATETLATPQRRTDSDFLEEALERQRASPYFDETLEERIDRVLARVKGGHGGPHAGFATALRKQRSGDSRSTVGPPLRDEALSNGPTPERSLSRQTETHPDELAGSPPKYRVDASIDRLVALVLAAVPSTTIPTLAAPSDELFSMRPDATQLVVMRKWYGSSVDTLSALEAKLDSLGASLVT